MTSPAITQAFFSAVLLIAGYFSYALVAAPLIEGEPPKPPVVEGGDPVEESYFEPPAARFQSLIEPLFPADSWERTDAKILKADRLLLLLKEYQIREDNRLHISPCTIVLLPAEGAPPSQSWVIQAIEGAILEFDADGDLRQGKLGKILAAFVPGSVQIRGTLPQTGEPVEVTSRNLQFDKNRVWTPHEVDMRVGKSRVAGRDFNVILNDLEDESVAAADGRLPGTVQSQIRSIELVQLEQLYIDPSDPWGAAIPAQFREVPVSVACGGSLFVDVISGVGRLTKQVLVTRRTSEEVFDKLACDELYAVFGAPAADDANPAPLMLKRVAARGVPARLATRQAPGDPLHQIESPEFGYRFGSQGGFSAAGPGRYHAGADAAHAEGEGSGALATWQSRMQWVDSGPRARLELEGLATVSADDFGRVQADRLGIEMERGTSTDAGPGALEPKRIWGAGAVAIDTPHLITRAQTIEVDLVAPAANAPAPVTEDGPILPPPTRPGPASLAQGEGSRFQISGGAVKAALVVGEEPMAIRSLTITEGVTCLEVRGHGKQAVSGLEMQGDTLQLRDFTAKRGSAVIQGAPARIRARQVDVEGAAVHLDRAANRIWVEGAGFARLPLPPTVTERLPQEVPQATLTWRKGMQFDGRTVTCGDQVTLNGPLQRIWCSQLSAELREPIDLSNGTLPLIAVNRVHADGQVRIENKTMGNRGLESLDTIQLADLSVWPETGQIVGNGPGSLETVRFGQVASLPGKGTQTPTQGPGTQQKLVYLGVTFQQKLEGNLNHRQIDFRERVQATFGPVSDWQQRIQATDPRGLPEGSLMMNCDQLSVFQIVKRFNDGLPIEIAALGNVLIQGGEFSAQAHRMSYDQAKDLLVLEGQGRANAKLWRNGGQGQAATQAQKIQFWPQSKQVKFDGFQGAVWDAG